MPDIYIGDPPPELPPQDGPEVDPVHERIVEDLLMDTGDMIEALSNMLDDEAVAEKLVNGIREDDMLQRFRECVQDFYPGYTHLYNETYKTMKRERDEY